MVTLNYVEIGRRIKSRRKELGLRQKDLAIKMNLSEGSISRYEKGKIGDAGTGTLNQFAKVLNVEPSWLIGFKEESEFDFRFKLLMKRASFLDDKKQQHILNILENLIEMLEE